MKVGIIGLGNFGRFAAVTLARDADLAVLAYDVGAVKVPKGVRKATLSEVAATDAIILCVPLSVYDAVLPQLAPLLKPETLVVDICSVKVEAEKRIRRHLPRHENLLITHPMFGPQSAADGTAGHVLVVTGAFGERAEQAMTYCQDKLGLKIMRLTNEEHDKAMADVHALTFFVARGLAETGLRVSPLQVPSFQRLLDLVALDSSNSEDLFRTIEIGNPYAKSSRERFVKTLQQINQRLEEEKL